jgi:hypothetical protein
MDANSVESRARRRPDSNPYRQWLDGDRIGKKPRDMTDAELIKFTSAGAVVIIQRMKSLHPYLLELRKRFHKLERGEKLCGFRNWAEYCTKHLGKTKRALNYMLAGGNKNRVDVLPKQNLLGDGEDLPEAKRWTAAGRTKEAWKDVEAGLQLLAEAHRLLGLPITEAMADELKILVSSAIQTLNEAITKLSAIE